MKTTLAGPVDISGQAPASFAGIVNAVTVNIGWNKIETSKGVFDFSAIDAALAKAGGADVLLRLMAGTQSPDFIKTEVGTVLMAEPQSGATGQVPKWWDPHFLGAWRIFNTVLGTRYDSSTHIKEVTCSASMTIFAEPMMRGGTHNKPALAAAGYTEAADLASYVAGLQAMLYGWPTTRISFACNPYQSQQGSDPVATTNSVIDALVAAAGPHLLLCNNSLRSPLSALGKPYTDIYAHMGAAGVPVGFQTATPARIGDTLTTIKEAVTMKACRVELPSDYAHKITPAQLNPLAAALAANAR